jgi:hypothetical protein
MQHKFDAGLIPKPLTGHGPPALRKLLAGDLHVRQVHESDAWLCAAYEILAAQFDSRELDPLERYVEWLQLHRDGKHPFPPLMLTAYFQESGCAYLAGVISGNLMPVLAHVNPLPSLARPPFIYAVGHQVTSSAVRRYGFKGVGRTLWQASIEVARGVAEDSGGSLLYSVLESQPDSTGYWTKLGYLWPKGVTYWQPPLSFDPDGFPTSPEVPEVLMVRPDSSAVSKTHIDKQFLENIISCLYHNWSLHKYRGVLRDDAIRRAEDYVMATVFGRVCRSMPEPHTLELIHLDR